MTCEEYLSNMKPGYIVDGGSEEHLVMHELSQRALKITMELNNKYHTKEEIIQLMSELTGQKIDESFGMFPPFYTDCGRNIHIGKNVFINAGCKFQDQGGIYIEDGVLIGHNAVLATINHMEDPEKRAGMIFQPIHIEKKVWLGANVTVLPGVTIGEGSVIALVPCVTGPASSCLVIYEDWWESMSYCTVEKYMQTMASFMGNDNQACRKLFKGKRGTGLLFNDGSIFVQVKLSDKAPSLGYVRLSAIRSLYTDGEGKCIIGLSGGRELLTHWSLPTVERHIRLVRDVLSPKAGRKELEWKAPEKNPIRIPAAIE